jgi:hypothetical protein
VRAALALVLAGCLDKPPFDCALVPATGQVEATLGTDGGGLETPGDCGDGALVGLAVLQQLDPDAMFAARLVVTVTMSCAPLVDRDAVVTAGAPVSIAVEGGSQPQTEGPYAASCPAGSAVVGLAAHLAGGTHLLDAVVLDCQRLDASGRPSGAITAVPIAETGSAPATADARCGDGEVVRGLVPHAGAQLDRLELACAALTCTP